MSKFLQPSDAIEILEPGSGLVINDEILEIGRQRIAAGEDPDEVALDLAILDESLSHPFGDPNADEEG